MKKVIAALAAVSSLCGAASAATVTFWGDLGGEVRGSFEALDDNGDGFFTSDEIVAFEAGWARGFFSPGQISVFSQIPDRVTYDIDQNELLLVSWRETIQCDFGDRTQRSFSYSNGGANIQLAIGGTFCNTTRPFSESGAVSSSIIGRTAAVPLPAAAWGLVAGLGALGAVRRLKRP